MRPCSHGAILAQNTVGMTKPATANSAGLHHVSDERDGPASGVSVLRPAFAIYDRTAARFSARGRAGHGIIKHSSSRRPWTDVWICPNPAVTCRRQAGDAAAAASNTGITRVFPPDGGEEAKVTPGLPAFAQALRAYPPGAPPRMCAGEASHA